MGYRDYPVQRRMPVWGSNSVLFILVVVNVLVFILMHFIKTVYGLSRLPEESFYRNILAWFTLPADGGTFLERPWTLLTSFITHMQLWMLLANLLWLWVFGYILQDLAGERLLVPIYLYGGLAGALTFLATYQLVPSLQPQAAQAVMMGATPAVLAVAVAATVLSPQYRVFPMISGGLPLWVLMLVFAVIDVASISRSVSFFYVHVVAALTGFVFSKGLLRGIDAAAWMNRFYVHATRLFQPGRTALKRKLHREEVFYNTRGQQPFTRKSNITQQRVDEILDKISQKGYHRLTEEERDLLKRASEEDL
ncbi:MAG: rhomboid family intramembrane serine protease [Bacteroidetes bacterium]|nr:rhomboid family intramembrane serine protease [Bacteroidota bacterium]